MIAVSFSFFESTGGQGFSPLENGGGRAYKENG